MFLMLAFGVGWALREERESKFREGSGCSINVDSVEGS